MNTRVLRRTHLGILMVVLVFSSVARAGPLNVVEAAKRVVVDVGKVGETASQGKKGPVFVFEEYHTSRVGQLQIAIMLLRLYELYGVKTIGLEGALQSPKPLNGQWFHTAGGPTAKPFREDVAVRMVAEGEISAAEFMTLLFSDVETYGIELQAEYDIKLEVKGSPQIRYLIAIAEKSLTQADIRRINELQTQKKLDEAFEYTLTRDPWVTQQYRAIKNPASRSVESSLERIRAIQKKASDLGVNIESEVQEDMNQALHFFEAASKRSGTMVGNTLRLPGVASGRPVALIIGAAHTEHVLALLRKGNTAFVRITPLGLNPNYGMQSMKQFERKNERKWARESPGTLGRLLNAQRKPPPMIETATAQSYASLNLAALFIADAVRNTSPIPDGIWAQIGTLPELRIDRGSFRRDEADVIFRAWLKDTEGNEKEVWARVGTVNTPAQALKLEEKLLQAVADLGGGGRIPPRDPPPNSTPPKDEGPGDGKRVEIVINRVNTKALAVYGDSLDAVQRVGRISG